MPEAELLQLRASALDDLADRHVADVSARAEVEFDKLWEAGDDAKDHVVGHVHPLKRQAELAEALAARRFDRCHHLGKRTGVVCGAAFPAEKPHHQKLHKVGQSATCAAGCVSHDLTIS